MKTVNTAELTGAALDWAVAVCENVELDEKHKGIWFMSDADRVPYTPSTEWAQGGPIIERERITVVCAEGDYSSRLRGYQTFWVAVIGHQTSGTVYGSQGDNWGQQYQIDEDSVTGPTPLIAAMRCYVSSKLGDTVDVPEELL